LPNSPTIKIIEPYHIIESRITQAIDILYKRGDKPNITAAVKEFLVSLQWLRARWNGRKSKQDLYQKTESYLNIKS
jgi:hypothetical protein